MLVTEDLLLILLVAYLEKMMEKIVKLEFYINVLGIQLLEKA